MGITRRASNHLAIKKGQLNQYYNHGIEPISLAIEVIPLFYIPNDIELLGDSVISGNGTGKLDFGPGEQIFYGEFDGGRRKRVLIKIIGE
jgi:hypothetical protein